MCAVFRAVGGADRSPSERGLTKEKIRKNHRQLMLLNHPDRGNYIIYFYYTLFFINYEKVARPTWLRRSTRPRNF